MEIAGIFLPRPNDGFIYVALSIFPLEILPS